MPKIKQLKCFFGCVIDGPLHRFPKWDYPHTEKFDQWKSVLDSATQERGNNYIYNSIRICHRHFEDCFKSPSRRLTGNAVPTLNLRTATENVVSPLLDAEISPTSSHYEIDFSNSTVVQPGEMAQWDTKGKTFLITGGASGLGAQYAQAFLEHGAKNVAILDIAEELGAATAERLNAAHGNKAVFIKCDVSKEEDIARAFDAVLAHFKQIDVIINNAGVMVDSPTVWRTASDINWQGVVSFTLKGVKHMRKDEGGVGGTIINIASIMAITKFPYLPIYCGSKMAVVQFSQCLAMDPFYEDTGVRVMSMCLGATDTPLLQNLAARVWDPKHGKEMADAIEKGYIYQTRESAAAALLDMFRKGPPASIWMSVDNKPVKNITASIDRAFKDFENVIAGLND